MNLIETLKDIFTSSPANDFIFTCLNCDKEFDGKDVELFIKHQIVEKHFMAKKVQKSLLSKE